MPIILNGTSGIITPGITNTGPFIFEGPVTVPAGSASSPSVSFTGSTNTGLYLSATGAVSISTAGTQRVVVNASGSVGVGGNPSAFSRKAIQITDSEQGYFVSNIRSGFGCNTYYDGFNRYVVNGYSQLYAQDSVNGVHAWFNATSGTAGNTISFTQAMTLDPSGNLLLGTTTHANYSGGTTEFTIGVTSTGSTTGGAITFVNGSGLISYLGGQQSETALGTYTSTPLTFTTNNTERAQITSSGNIVINGGYFLTKTSSQSLAFFADPSAIDNTPRLEINGTSASVSANHTFIRSNTIVFTANAAASERGRFDSSGRWIVSSLGYQPRFLVERSGDQTGYNATSTGDVVVIYNSAIQNIGSHFSTSTGKFTAPVAGMYIFQASAFSSGGTAFDQSWLVVNGSRAVNTDNVYTASGATIGMGLFLIYLNANDTVGFHPYNGTNSNQTITANVYHTWFKGYLIG